MGMYRGVLDGPPRRLRQAVVVVAIVSIAAMIVAYGKIR